MRTVKLVVLATALLIAGPKAHSAPDVGDLDTLMSPDEIEAENSDFPIANDISSTQEETFKPPAAKLAAPSANPELVPTLGEHPSNDQIDQAVNVDLYKYFDLLLYVNKAAKGKTAQTMRVATKQNGAWTPIQNWPVSTGREKKEKYFTSTPVGLLRLDAKRMYVLAHSKTWNNAPMPYAMFIDVDLAGRKSGIAVHGATSHEKQLGQRASGGCVRLADKNAEWLYKYVHNAAGLKTVVPEFAYDNHYLHTNYFGIFALDQQAQTIFKDGYRILLAIVDRP